MSSAGSVTHWVQQLQAGDPDAAQPLWERYFRRMVGLARKKLQGRPHGAASEEDAALSAFKSFCLGAARGKFPDLRDRDNLWPLLILITARKASDLIQAARRLKRGGGREQGESALRGPHGLLGLDQIIGPDPSPAFAAQLADEYQRRLELLPSNELRQIAQWKMEGWTNEEIAAKLDCVVRTVGRKLGLIRKHWESKGKP